MGGKFITVGILISVFGALNGYLLTGPRVTYTLGANENFTSNDTLGKLNKSGSPANATLANSNISLHYMHYQDNSTY